jgi:integrase
MNPRQIQSFVGHADITMTLQTYGHLFDESGTEAATIMDRLRDEHRNGRETRVPGTTGSR